MKTLMTMMLSMFTMSAFADYKCRGTTPNGDGVTEYRVEVSQDSLNLSINDTRYDADNVSVSGASPILYIGTFNDSENRYNRFNKIEVEVSEIDGKLSGSLDVRYRGKDVRISESGVQLSCNIL